MPNRLMPGASRGDQRGRHLRNPKPSVISIAKTMGPAQRRAIAVLPKWRTGPPKMFGSGTWSVPSVP